MVNYQLTGTDCSSATFANLVKLSVDPVISSGANVIDVEMKIPKYWMDHTFAVLFTDGSHDATNTLCTRTNILEGLTLKDAKYANAKNTLIGNSVGHLLGLTVPVENALRLKELVDIMTEASQDANDTSVEGVRSLAIDTFCRKVIGDDDSSTDVGSSASTEKAHQITLTASEVTDCKTSSSARDAFTIKLAKHCALYLDSDFSGAAAGGTGYTNPTTTAGATMSSSETDNVDSIIGEIIKQAASFTPTRVNKLLGASAQGGQQGDTTDDPVPELSDEEKAFHFLHFEVGDILTFKNTVTVGTPISSANGGAQGDGTEAVGELIVNFNLTVASNTDADLDDHECIDSLGGTFS